MVAQIIPLACFTGIFENRQSLEIEELKQYQLVNNLPIGDTVTLSPSFLKTLKKIKIHTISPALKQKVFQWKKKARAKSYLINQKPTNVTLPQEHHSV